MGLISLDHYISFVLTSDEWARIKRLETLLAKAGLRGEYCEFKPGIPQLEVSFAVAVRIPPVDADQVRARIKMMLRPSLVVTR